VINGEGTFGKDTGSKKASQSTLIRTYIFFLKLTFMTVFEQKGDQVDVSTAESPVRFLLAAAKPLNEPVRYTIITELTLDRLRVTDRLL
jgi:hypothetical protein